MNLTRFGHFLFQIELSYENMLLTSHLVLNQLIHKKYIVSFCRSIIGLDIFNVELVLNLNLLLFSSG